MIYRLKNKFEPIFICNTILIIIFFFFFDSKWLYLLFIFITFLLGAVTFFVKRQFQIKSEHLVFSYKIKNRLLLKREIEYKNIFKISFFITKWKQKTIKIFVKSGPNLIIYYDKNDLYQNLEKELQRQNIQLEKTQDYLYIQKK